MESINVTREDIYKECDSLKIYENVDKEYVYEYLKLYGFKEKDKNKFNLREEIKKVPDIWGFEVEFE